MLRIAFCTSSESSVVALIFRRGLWEAIFEHELLKFSQVLRGKSGVEHADRSSGNLHFIRDLACFSAYTHCSTDGFECSEAEIVVTLFREMSFTVVEKFSYLRSNDLSIFYTL